MQGFVYRSISKNKSCSLLEHGDVSVCFYRSVVFERNLDLTDIFMNLVMRSSNQLWKNIANEGNAFEHNCKNDLIFLISFIKNNSIGLNIPCRSHI